MDIELSDELNNLQLESKSNHHKKLIEYLSTIPSDIIEWYYKYILDTNIIDPVFDIFIKKK